MPQLHLVKDIIPAQDSSVGRVAQSVELLATGWTVRGSNPGGGRDFSHLSRPALEPIQPSVQWVTCLSRG